MSLTVDEMAALAVECSDYNVRRRLLCAIGLLDDELALELTRGNAVTSIKQRIADVLGWSPGDTDSFSLATLREWVREKDPQLASDITEVIRRGWHLVERQPT